MSKAPRKLDIKDVLYNIDKKNIEWYSTLSEDQKNEFSPFVIMQFLSSSGSNDEISLELSNLVLNNNFSKKSSDKELFYRLACIIGTGKSAYHPYTKPPKTNKTKSSSLVVSLLSQYTNEIVSDQEANIIIKKNKNICDIDYWIMIAESLNWDNSQIKKLESEIKAIVKK